MNLARFFFDKYASTDSRFFDVTSYFQGGCHDVISRCRLPTLWHMQHYARATAGIARRQRVTLVPDPP